MVHDMSEVITAIEYGVSSLHYEPDRGLAIAPSLSVLHEARDLIPKGYDLVYLQPQQFHTASGSLAGRKHVILFDGGNVVWRSEIEQALRNVNANVDPPPSKLVLVRGDLIIPQPIRWIWYEWLARGKLHIFAGVPGTGKTTIALALASILTAGDRWPDGTDAKCSSVLIWSGEDDPQDTLVPRLMAMRANMSQVHFISGVDDQQGRRSFDPAYDAEILMTAVQKIKPALLIIDPIVSAVAGDSHKNTETRRALQPLVDLAAELEVAILGISHFSKGTANRDPLERVTGSLAFGAVARIVMVAAKLPDEKGGGRIFCRAKSNIGTDTGGFRYDMEQVPILTDLFACRIKWGDVVNETAHELLVETEVQSRRNSSETEAIEFLKTELKEGAVAVNSIEEASKLAGHAWRTIERAKKKIGVVSYKISVTEGGHWAWRLPSTKAVDQKDECQSNNVAVLTVLPTVTVSHD